MRKLNRAEDQTAGAEANTGGARKRKWKRKWNWKRKRKKKKEMELENGIYRFLHGKIEFWIAAENRWKSPPRIACAELPDAMHHKIAMPLCTEKLICRYAPQNHHAATM